MAKRKSMTKEEFEKIKQIFFEKLDQKTSWGKNEVKRLWIEAITEFLLEKDLQVENKEIKQWQ